MAESSRPDGSGAGVNQTFYQRMASTWGPSGIYGVPSDQALVYADGTGTRRVFVRPGRGGIVRGYDWDSGGSGDAPIPVDLPANTSGLTRVDWIVLRLTQSGSWPIRAGFVTGQPGSGSMPALTQAAAPGVYEMPIAAVSVANGAGALAGGAVSRREWYVSSGGGLLCTAATMPPYVLLGQVLTQTDTGRVYVGAAVEGTREWRLVGEQDQSAVVTAAGYSLTSVLYRRNGWVVAATTGQRPVGIVAANATVTVATIPSGWRPPVDFWTPLALPNSISGITTHFGIYRASGQLQIIASAAGGIGAGQGFAFGAAMWPSI